MTRAAWVSFAALVLAWQSGCAARQPIEPRVLSEEHGPASLVGKTIRYRTLEGKTEALDVMRAEGTMLVGRRPTFEPDLRGDVVVDAREITEVVIVRDHATEGRRFAARVALGVVATALEILALVAMVTLVLP